MSSHVTPVVPLRQDPPDVEAPVDQEQHDAVSAEAMSEDAKAAEVITLLFTHTDIQNKVITALTHHNEHVANRPDAAIGVTDTTQVVNAL